MKFTIQCLGLAALFMLSACSGQSEARGSAPALAPQSTDTPGPAKVLSGAVKPTLYTHTIVNTYPHTGATFTQGLLFHDGFLYESTGKYGASEVRKLVVESGELIKKTAISSQYFGEGMTRWNDTLIFLTWKAGTGFVLDLETFAETGTFGYPGEGWGLTNNDTHLIQSDGTNILRFLDPETFSITKTLPVKMNGKPLQKLNELEWIQGEIWANVWQSDIIVRIDADSGNVVGVIDFANLFPPHSRGNPSDDVLNGIAYDSETGRIFITGKKWPNIYEIAVSELGSPQ